VTLISRINHIILVIYSLIVTLFT
jgi:hypothetical protein